MTIQELKDKQLIVFECISGSHAYGLQTEHSDIDIKGVFILAEEDYYGLDYIAQVNDETNDTVYYELRRFMELLSKNNPNILEMLYSPEDCIQLIHPVFEPIRREAFLSKICEHSFGGYAMTQVKKAKGLNKKVLNPLPAERKTVLDFCYVVDGQGSQRLLDFLAERSINQSECGLSKIAHMPDLFGLYHGKEHYRGIMSSSEANDISLSSVAKDIQPIAIMSFNKTAYSVYCKDYKAYWDWVENRNEQRYQNTLGHGKNYDAKNMMHTIRLLTVAEEIGKTGRLQVRRPDREYLLSIKQGDYDYDELLALAETKTEEIRKAYKKSNLPEKPDLNLIRELLIQVRQDFYKLKREKG